MAKNRVNYFGYQQGDIQLSACAYCKHKHTNGGGNTATCEAFPDGIPEEILMMENDHLTPIEGDHGIRFEATNPETVPARLRDKAK